MILATRADQPAIEAFLKSHIATSMFPLANLQTHGMAGHPRSMQFWLDWQNGQIAGALGVSEEGILFPQCPDAPWAVARTLIAHQPIKGIMGAARQVAGLSKVLGLIAKPALNEVEPLFHLPLHRLEHLDVTGFELKPLAEAPQELVLKWRVAYKNEVLNLPGEDTEKVARQDIGSYLTRDSHRVLIFDAHPVAITGFNAQTVDTVQIGGVYTPPEFRGRGFARRAVALHLGEARERGVTDAVLFAASEAAARAYMSIGFEKVGEFAMCLYSDPQVIHG